jgi:hypothetical protein
MRLLLTHLPHIVPAIIALVFLGRFAFASASMPPAGLTDEQLRHWQASRRRTGLRRLVPRR